MQLFENETMFPTTYTEILQRISLVDPVKYGQSRNYIDGAVSYLSPYISRGVISTHQILTHMLDRGYRPGQIEKFIQELAWRDYWQNIWINKGEAIDTDLKKAQAPVSNYGLPKAIVTATTGIHAVDNAVSEFYTTGYIHNHLRMYIAAICCNMGQAHWNYPAKWMYYHLLDGDWASNALSWQWVAGSNSNKKYVANQENINTYCHTQQKGTFLDVAYSAFSEMEIPDILKDTSYEPVRTPLPSPSPIKIDASLPTYLYNYYNLDPKWDAEIKANRILLLEPSVFDRYPVSRKSLDFMLSLSKNITDVQVYVGEFDALVAAYDIHEIRFKEHPLNNNYKGTEVARDWMFDVSGYFSSFFGFWKKCKKQLTY